METGFRWAAILRRHIDGGSRPRRNAVKASTIPQPIMESTQARLPIGMIPTVGAGADRYFAPRTPRGVPSARGWDYPTPSSSISQDDPGVRWTTSESQTVVAFRNVTTRFFCKVKTAPTWTVR